MQPCRRQQLEHVVVDALGDPFSLQGTHLLIEHAFQQLLDRDVGEGYHRQGHLSLGIEERSSPGSEPVPATMGVLDLEVINHRGLTRKRAGDGKLGTGIRRVGARAVEPMGHRAVAGSGRLHRADELHRRSIPA